MLSLLLWITYWRQICSTQAFDLCSWIEILSLAQRPKDPDVQSSVLVSPNNLIHLYVTWARISSFPWACKKSLMHSGPCTACYTRDYLIYTYTPAHTDSHSPSHTHKWSKVSRCFHSCRDWDEAAEGRKRFSFKVISLAKNIFHSSLIHSVEFNATDFQLKP